MKRRYTDLHGQCQNLLNVDGILLSSNTRAKSTSKTRGLINLKKEKLKIRRVEHNAMREQHAVHIGFEAGMTAETLEIHGKRLSVKGLLEPFAVSSDMPVDTCAVIMLTLARCLC